MDNMKTVGDLMGKLYGNIGGKLRILAMVCGALGIVCIAIGLFLELVTFFDAFNGIVLVTCGVLGLACLLASWPLYAFGQLVDDVHKMAENSAQPKAAGTDALK